MKRVLLFLMPFYLTIACLFVEVPYGFTQNQCCNVLTNGDFEMGDVGFSSGLNQNCICVANSYCVSTNFQSKCSGWPNLSDHTSGGGNFLIIDGNPSVPVDVWSTTVNLVPGLTYCFSFWTANVYSNTFDLGLSVDGVLLPGAVFTVQPGPVWSQVSFSWVAGSGSTIAIRQLIAGDQRDFGIDDIEFGPELQPGFSWQQDIACGMKIDFTNQSTGPLPLIYAWNFGEPISPYNTSNLENPMHTYSECQDFEVCLTISHDQCSAQYCQMVSPSDIESPSIVCPPDITVQAALPDCQMVVDDIGLLSATDNCGNLDIDYIVSGVTSNLGQNDASGLIFQNGVSTVTYIGTDLCGNSTSCSFDIEIQCPLCDCKDIEMVIQPISNNIDVCCYRLVLENDQGDCFPSIHLQVDAGLSITAWNVMATGWTVVQINPQYIEILPPNSFIPSGSYTPITFCVAGGSVHDMIVFTGYEENMVSVECSQPFSFDCSMSGPCPNNLVKNANFESGTPNGFDESISLATDWGPIWLPSGGSTADFWNTVGPTPLNGIGLPTPTPVTQGNFAGFWCHPTTDINWREGILGELNQYIPFNSGTYNLEFKIACSKYDFGSPGLSVYGVPVNAIQVTLTDGATPFNPNLSTPDAAILLAQPYLISSSNCVQNFQKVTVGPFNASILPAQGIDRIFLTRTDGQSGKAYVDIDDVCLTKIKDPCLADISFQEDSCMWFTFTGYANNTTGSVTYTWDFGDNTSGSGSSISHHYLNGGTYTVSLTITDQGGCMASYSVQVTVPVLPSVSVATSQSTICLGQSATLVASGSAGNVYSWSSGGSGNTITLTPTTAGTYSYTVTAQLNGCTATATQVVQVLVCDCEGSLLTNGSFSIGVPGSLPNKGNALGWIPIFSPQMVMSDGYLTPGCMQMWGNQIVGEGIVQAANFQPGCSYEISFAAKVFPISGPQPVQLRLRATNGPFVVGSNPPNYFDCPTGSCEQILLSGPLTNNWAWYGPFSWTATNSSLNNLVATVWNNSSQQDPGETSWLRLDSLCIQQEFCPNECTCGVFSETGFGYEKGPFIPAGCDSMTITPVQCPNPDQGFWFSGMLTCSGTNCASSTPVEWELWYTSSGSPYMIASNVTQASPWFGIVLNASYFTAGGVYELRLKGKCGTNDCICVVGFEMPPCQNQCPCDETEFKRDVSAGFYSATVISQCRACFTPGKLKDCDLVEWTISPLDTNFVNPLGTTAGRQKYCFSFAKGGTYTVEMHVTRICPDGTVLNAVFSKKIYINCAGGENPNCNSSLSNPDFNGGAEAGILGNGGAGKSDNWLAIVGSPEVIDSSNSMSKDRDGWYIALSGNNDTSDVLGTDKPDCLSREGTIVIRAAEQRNRPEGRREMVFVDLVQGDMWSLDPCEGNDCYEVACLEFPEDADGWVDFTFDYDLSQIFLTDSCGSSMEDNVPFRPVISIGNRLSNEQGDPAETKSTVLLSFVCTADSSLTATESPKINTQFHLFPNPTFGTITMVLPEYATRDITIRVVGLAGNVVLEQEASTGSLQQTIQTDHLPNGLYFVQVMSKGSQLWIGRFVKQ